MTSKNRATGSSPSANRAEVVEAVVRRSSMTRATVESVLSFLEQSGYRVVPGGAAQPK